MKRKQYHPRDEIPPERLQAVERLESGQPLSDEDLYQLKIYIIMLEEDSGMAMRYLDQDIERNERILELLDAQAKLLQDMGITVADLNTLSEQVGDDVLRERYGDLE